MSNPSLKGKGLPCKACDKRSILCWVVATTGARTYCWYHREEEHGKVSEKDLVLAEAYHSTLRKATKIFIKVTSLGYISNSYRHPWRHLTSTKDSHHSDQSVTPLASELYTASPGCFLCQFTPTSAVPVQTLAEPSLAEQAPPLHISRRLQPQPPE
jgi:hypothetical protein